MPSDLLPKVSSELAVYFRTRKAHLAAVEVTVETINVYGDTVLGNVRLTLGISQ